MRLRTLAFATFLVWRLRIGACGFGAYDSYPGIFVSGGWTKEGGIPRAAIVQSASFGEREPAVMTNRLSLKSVSESQGNPQGYRVARAQSVKELVANARTEFVNPFGNFPHVNNNLHRIKPEVQKTLAAHDPRYQFFSP